MAIGVDHASISFGLWDPREGAVGRAAAEAWRERCARLMRSERDGQAEIPRVIHQIWIGPREPPCLWLDTFRVDYMASNPGWHYHLWTDTEVATLPMINRALYAQEEDWQCKADILRLEILWRYGGIYLDADMVSVQHRSLDPVIECGRPTGFVLAFEPDTDGKPYSVLGNSVIACTPRHPLTLMLILYLAETYPHTRPGQEVHMSTGPLMYNKCLVDSGMPFSLAETELLYPAFHYVPEPDAIDLASFPRSLVFQFGYTCTGLEDYISRRNTCRAGLACRYHGMRAEVAEQNLTEDGPRQGNGSDKEDEQTEDTEAMDEEGEEPEVKHFFDIDAEGGYEAVA